MSTAYFVPAECLYMILEPIPGSKINYTMLVTGKYLYIYATSADMC